MEIEYIYVVPYLVSCSNESWNNVFILCLKLMKTLGTYKGCPKNEQPAPTHLDFFSKLKLIITD